MSILVFGLGTTGQVSSFFGKEVKIDVESQPEIVVEVLEAVNVDVDAQPEVIVNVDVDDVGIDINEQELNVDKSCPPL